MFNLASFVLLGSFCIGLILLFLFKNFAVKRKLFMPKGIPLIGGPALTLAFILTSFCAFLAQQGALPKEILGLLAASFLILVFGLIDDRFELSVGAKFLAQIIATSILVIFGVRTQIVHIGNLLNILITFIWIIAITNAFNHLDIMDGAAAISALVISTAFLIIALIQGDFRMLILSAGLVGSSLSFLIFNLPPARIYMGNSGSHFLGFVLAAAALMLSYASMERKIALISPLLILGFPIYDTAFLILIRLLKKKAPYRKSNDHLILRFLASGHSKAKTLVRVFFLNLFFVFAGILTSRVSNAAGILTIVIVILTSLALSIKMSKVAIND